MVSTAGMERVFVSVSSLAEALAFYRDVAGLKVRAEDALPSQEVQGLYGLPPGARARAVLLGNDVQSTLVELVEFVPSSGATIRADPPGWECGIYDLNFRIEGIDALYGDMRARGFSFVSPPQRYRPFRNEVKEVVMLGPDNTPIAFLQRPLEADAPAPRFLEMGDSAQVVRDTEEAVRFYCGLLGLEVLARTVPAKGALDALMGLPPGSEARLTFVGREPSLVVAFIDLSVKAPPLGAKARPPHCGVFMYSFEVEDLGGMLRTMNDAGFPTLSGPVEFERSLQGRLRAAIVEGPNGEMVELLERPGRRRSSPQQS